MNAAMPTPRAAGANAMTAIDSMTLFGETPPREMEAMATATMPKEASAQIAAKMRYGTKGGHSSIYVILLGLSGCGLTGSSPRIGDYWAGSDGGEGGALREGGGLLSVAAGAGGYGLGGGPVATRAAITRNRQPATRGTSLTMPEIFQAITNWATPNAANTMDAIRCLVILGVVGR
jgi:hypothetical protein